MTATVETTRSRTGELMGGLRRAPLFTHLVGSEAQVGWPLPQRRARADGTDVYLTFPLFRIGVPTTRGDLQPCYPPFATLVVDWLRGRPVAFENLAFRQPWPFERDPEPAGWFPDARLAGYSVDDYIRARTRLLELYDELLSVLESGAGRFAGSTEFSRLFSVLLEPGLLPYYRLLDGGFVDSVGGRPESPGADR